MTLRVMLLGLGAMGKFWLQTVSADGRAELVAVVEPHAPTRDALIQSGRIPRERVFSSFEQTGDVDADAVIVVTPPDAHEACCASAAARGLHILCEKPLAPGFDAAKRAVEAAERAGVTLMVAQNRRHLPFIHGMRALVASGEWGAPGQVFVTFRHIFTRDSFRDVMDHPLLIDMSNHHFDTVRYVLGREPAGVRALEWNPPWSRFRGAASATAVFDYPGGLFVCYQGTWHTIDTAKTSNGCDWRIECERGVIACRDERLFAGPIGGELSPVESPEMPLQMGAYLLDEFISCVETGKSPATGGRDNLGTLAMVFGAVRAAETGARAELGGEWQRGETP